MTETTVPRYGGGWNTNYVRMSPAVRARIEDADRAYARECAQAERERAARAAAFEESSVRASIAAAMDRGELVDPIQAWRDGGVGRTHAEVLAEASARMDLEDRREAHRRAKEGAELSDAAWSEQHSADVSAPFVTEEQAQRESARAEERQFVKRAWNVARSVLSTERANGRL